MTAPSRVLRTPRALAEAGLAAPDRLADLERVAARYAVAVTPASAALIDRNDPDDPIGRQFLPDPAELEVEPGERADPVGDAVHSPLAGIVHRYRDRVLLMATHACATYCRFCFRREVVGPGKGETLTPRALAAALAYIAADPGIWEVILTGGDPLVLSPRRLGRIFEGLGQIGHVKVVRLHTRVPAVDPARISAAMIEALKRSGKAVYVALHANHPRELTPEARAACARLVDAGFPMVSQTVLLKGVNDDPAVLADLMRAFVETRIKPYYLHHGDLAPGTGRHRVALADGQALLRSIRGEVSGLCQPTFVLDIPGGFGKVPVGPCYVRDAGEGRLWIKDPSGDERLYPPPST